MESVVTHRFVVSPLMFHTVMGYRLAIDLFFSIFTQQKPSRARVPRRNQSPPQSIKQLCEINALIPAINAVHVKNRYIVTTRLIYFICGKKLFDF